MIQLRRVRQADAIPKIFRGSDRIERFLILVERRRTDEEFNANFWKGKDLWKKAKAQLKKETAGKCAYCEASTAKVAHGDVEHFRPKAKYWWLAYCYENYLYSCQICNEVFKGEKFPIFGNVLAEPVLPAVDLEEQALRAAAALFTPDPLNDAEGFSLSAFQQSLRGELAGLPDPYLDDPEPLFKWIADPVQKEVSIAPRGDSPEASRAFAAVRDVFGLNREELKRARWVLYQQLDYLRQALPALPPDLRAKGEDIIRAMMEGDAEFAGMVRYFVRDEWQLDLG